MMTRNRTVQRTGFFALVLLLLSVLPANGQECLCPTLAECSPCSGGISSFTLLYEGNQEGSITINDDLGSVYSGTINPGQTFTVNSRTPGQSFSGPFIEIYIAEIFITQISTQCNFIVVGQVYDDFKIRAAQSRNGGPLCCPSELLDTTPPNFISCTSNIQVSLPQDACSVPVNWSNPPVSDNCGSPVLTVSKASGSLFVLGTTTVTHTATDKYGNQSTCDFNVTVVDDTPPVFTSCPSNIQVSANSNCSATATWTNPVAQDNCSANISGTHTSGSVFPLGVTTVTYTASDPSGNQSTCSFTVTVVDNSAPVFTSCPSNIQMSANSNCSAMATWTNPIAQDNCSVNITGTHTSGSAFPLGVTTVTYTATDPSGNQSTCSFTVTVVDNSPPVFNSCPSNILLDANNNCNRTVSWTAPVAQDNCSVQVTASHIPGSTFPVGVTTVAYTATDQNGNQATCSFTVTVVDNSAPMFTSCPSNIQVSANSNCSATATWTNPIAQDNCSVNITGTHTSGSAFPLGVTTVTYTATDPSGNQSTCSFTVTVVDNSPPVFNSCPSNILLDANNNCNRTVSWTAPVAQDNCSVQVTASHIPGSTFPVGVTTVAYTATDQNGNQATCSFTVTVVDSSPPAFNSCPPNSSLTTTNGCSRVVNWGAPVAQDNCSFTVTASHMPGSTFPVGVTTVTYTATDQNGNQATCSFTVTIRDNTNPVFTNCPTNIELTASTSCTAIASWTPPTAQDNCSANVTTSHQPGTAFPIGETVVTYTATDPGGNTATCSFTVTVNNTQLPILESCPENILVDADESDTAIVTWDEPEFSIACGELTITQSHEPGDVFPEGATQVIYTAENEAGDAVECRFTVTVNRKVLNLKATPAITPNGDGIQDVWIIQDIEFFPNNRVVVVDRWGGIVYEASGYNNVSVVWTGENTSGNLLPTGTYFYRIEIQQTREVLTGSIELVR